MALYVDINMNEEASIGHTEEAMNLYVSLLFDDGKDLDVARRQKGEQGAEGRIKPARFRAAGQSVADRFGVSWQLNLA